MTYSDDPAAYQRAYYAANRERIRARQRAKGRTEASLAQNREYMRQRRAANPEEARTRDRTWREANRDAINARRRTWRKREEVRAKERAYQRANLDKSRLRAMKHLHGLTPEDWSALWDRQSGRCYLCNRPLDTTGDRLVHVDHDHTHCPGARSCRVCQRGLACKSCNSLIGLADDDPDRLLLIADNLEAALTAVRARMATAPTQLELGA